MRPEVRAGAGKAIGRDRHRRGCSRSRLPARGRRIGADSLKTFLGFPRGGKDRVERS